MTSHTVFSSDGTPIAYWTSGDGPPLVLVHGTTADHTRWPAVLPLLEPYASVSALDRRGRGGSGDHADYAPEREFEDIAAVATAVADRAGTPVDLLGHSYGAICALGGARLAADAVRRLMLYEPPILVDNGSQASGAIERLESLLAQGRAAEVVEVFLREQAGVPESELDLLRSLPNWPARVAAAHTIPRELRAVGDFNPDPDWFAAARMPTLLLLGGASPEWMEQATTLVQAALPDARVEVLSGQQHLAMNTAPELFARHVLAFLPNPTVTTDGGSAG